MYIFSQLKKHPVILLGTYFGLLIIILISMTNGEKSSEAKQVTSKAVDTSTVDKSTVEVSKLVADKDSSKTEDVKVEAAAAKIEEKTVAAKTMAEDLEETAKNTEYDELNSEELLLAARESYWNNGLEESKKLYLKLVELSPDVIDYKGELGNVYWRLGEHKKAAESYADIAFPMIEAGDNAKVANMVGFIGFHYPEIATNIHNALEASK